MSTPGPSGAVDGDALAAARRVADAVLYEGYVLYPYHASAQKNRYRWQFGVVVPEAQVRAGSSEPCEVRSQCLLRGGPATRVEVITRFLQPRRRQVEEVAADAHRPVDQLEVAGQLVTSWDEGRQHEVSSGPVALGDLFAGSHPVDLSLAADRAVEQLTDASGVLHGRVVRSAASVDAVAEVTAAQLSDDVVRLTTVVRNRTDWSSPQAPREEVMRRSLAGVHLLLAVHAGVFASSIDPPEWAARWTSRLVNHHTYPVLMGPPGADDLVLSAPIILSDHPELAPESTGEAFDATEIDELLMLSVQAMTDEEKRQARATDPRAAEVVDRADALPPEVMERLHGAIRQFDPADRPVDAASEGSVPSAADASGAPSGRIDVDEELAAFLGVDEEPLAEVAVDGRVLALGDRVRLRPGRRADAQDLFAAGRLATVARIERDLEGATYIAVTLVDDPAAEIHEWARRFLYFHPEEVEPVPAAGESERQHEEGSR